MTNLQELLDRVKAATWPDRELDCEIHDVTTGTTDHYAPPYTDSIDAALALTERVLPGWVYDFHSARRGAKNSAVVMEQKESRRIVVGEGHTIALAIIAATLAALIAKDTQP